MPAPPLHRMLVVHNVVGQADRVRVIDRKPFRKFAFGSLLAHADEVLFRIGRRPLLVSHSLALPADIASYDEEQLRAVPVDEKYDSVTCHLVLDHGGSVTDRFFSTLRADFLKPGGTLLNAVRSITKNDVARASEFELETRTAPCVIKKNDNYNEPETVFELHTQAELDAWRARTPAEEQARYVSHKLLRYFAAGELGMHQLERWVVLFDDLTVNRRCSDEFYVKSRTSLSYYVRDERRMKRDVEQLAATGHDWKGRTIDCAYEHDPEAWDARYAVLATFRKAFRFDSAELDVIRTAKNEFVVIDVNNTPGPAHKNAHFRALAVRLLADGLGIPLDAAPPPPSAEPAAPAEPAADHRHDAPRDVALLEQELARNPNDPRARFRLAQAYEEAGLLEQALAAFKKRAETEDGDAEERFVAKLETGRLALRLDQPEPVVSAAFFAAYALRPTRAEPLYELARYYRGRGAHPMAALFAKAGVRTPRPNDKLEVADSVYRWQLLDELAVASYFIGDFETCRSACQTLLEQIERGLEVPHGEVERIRRNWAEASAKLDATGAGPRGSE